ncbi:unnamed protein product, partial [Acanthoscelides obtectus]
SDDSTPGAIALLSKNGSNPADKQLSDTEDTQTLMKRYLQCPGMCRIEVLKKFIDILYKKVPLPDHYTLIDIAYIYIWRRNEPMKFYFRITDVNKDAAADAGSCGDSTPQKSISVGKQPLTRTPKVNGDRSAKKRESIRQKNAKVSQTKANLLNKLKNDLTMRSRGTRSVDVKSAKNKTNGAETEEDTKASDKVSDSEKSGDTDAEVTDKIVNRSCSEKSMDVKAEVTDKVVNRSCSDKSSDIKAEVVNRSCKVEAKVEKDGDRSSYNTSISTKHADNNGSGSCKPSNNNTKISYKITSTGANLENNNSINITIKKERSLIKQDSDASLTNTFEPAELQVAEQLQLVKQETDSPKAQHPEDSQNQIHLIESSVLKSEANEQNTNRTEKSETKNAVYTSITLNRSNNVEIITKIQKVSNKEGQAIGLNIIKKTIQKSANNVPKQVIKLECDKKSTVKEEAEADKTVTPTTPVKSCVKVEAHEVKSPTSTGASVSEDEKLKFLSSMELTTKNTLQDSVQKQNTSNLLPVQSSASQKRKNSSPIKNDKSKKIKTDGRKPGIRRIIIQPKVPIPGTTTAKTTGLQSIIENCKIPSSLSITIKEGNEASRLPSMVPPVKNFIEILKLPDESAKTAEKPAATAKFNFNTICDNDSEQKVDEDLSEIARSLTEKIPMSTTVSQILGPKPQYPIPVKSSATTKVTILPSPVPEVAPALSTPVPSKSLTLPKDKLSQKSRQTFQKIFEESIKRPDAVKSPEKETPQKAALDLSEASTTPNNSKRTILEIASKLYKKTKLEQEKCHPEVKVDERIVSPPPLPKVPIPRLNNHRYMKPQPKVKNVRFEVTDPAKYTQTLANLHSNALGLNYTISIGHNLNQNGNTMLQAPKQEEVKVRFIPPCSSYKPAKETFCSSPKPSPFPKISPGLGLESPKSSPKHSPKSSPLIKHMYAPVPSLMMDQHRVQSYSPQIPSPISPKLPLPVASPTLSQPNTTSSPKPSSSSPKPSPKSGAAPHPLVIKAASAKSIETANTSNASTPLSVKTPASSNGSPPAKSSPKAGSSQSQSSPLSPNQILEKYNIQNLAQLTASLNFNPATFGLNPSNQLAALQQAMLLKHFEMQNRQNWLSNLNQGPLLQYEKYLQSLKPNQNPLLGNIKEN